MATRNQVDVVLSGTSGTVNFVGTTSPTLITPTLGAATATTIAFNPTTGGLVGTTTNNNASAGTVGEFISSVISSGAPVTFSAATQKDLTSISLTAGDWDVFANITFTATTISEISAWISATSATFPARPGYNYFQPQPATNTQCSCLAPFFRASLSGTTTIYMTGYVNGTGTFLGSGGIYARRRR